VFNRQKYADGIHAQGSLPILYGEFGDAFAAAGDTGVGINAVNAAVFADAFFDKMDYRRFIADVSLDRDGCAACLSDLSYRLFNAIGEVYTNYLSAITGSQFASGATNTATGACNDNSLVF
jgi:hypothetical protein